MHRAELAHRAALRHLTILLGRASGRRGAAKHIDLFALLVASGNVRIVTGGADLVAASIAIGFERWDGIDDSECASSISARRYAFFMNTLVLHLVTSQVLELSLKLASYKHLLRSRLNPKQIDVLGVKLIKFDRVETESGQSPHGDLIGIHGGRQQASVGIGGAAHFPVRSTQLLGVH